MTMVSLPNLQTMIEAISEQKKLPTSVVEAALKEALLKGYERYRRTQHMGNPTLRKNTLRTLKWNWMWMEKASGF